MAKIALTYRNENNIICTEIVDTNTSRYQELTERVFTSNQVFLSSQVVDENTNIGVVSRKKILRYATEKNSYREKEIEYRMEKSEDGTEVPRFIDFKPFLIMGLTIDKAATQEGDRLKFNVGSNGEIIPLDINQMKAFRYVMRILQPFNATLLTEDDDEDSLDTDDSSNSSSEEQKGFDHGHNNMH